MPARFTTDDGDAYTADDGEFVLFSEYESVLSKLVSKEKELDELRGTMAHHRPELAAMIVDLQSRLNSVVEAVERWEAGTIADPREGMKIIQAAVVERQEPKSSGDFLESSGIRR